MVKIKARNVKADYNDLREEQKSAVLSFLKALQILKEENNDCQNEIVDNLISRFSNKNMTRIEFESLMTHLWEEVPYFIFLKISRAIDTLGVTPVFGMDAHKKIY